MLELDSNFSDASQLHRFVSDSTPNRSDRARAPPSTIHILRYASVWFSFSSPILILFKLYQGPEALYGGHGSPVFLYGLFLNDLECQKRIAKQILEGMRRYIASISISIWRKEKEKGYRSLLVLDLTGGLLAASLLAWLHRNRRIAPHTSHISISIYTHTLVWFVIVLLCASVLCPTRWSGHAGSIDEGQVTKHHHKLLSLLVRWLLSWRAAATVFPLPTLFGARWWILSVRHISSPAQEHRGRQPAS